jgi:hypothetical protein
MKRLVHLTFEGFVEVDNIPDDLTDKEADDLADNLALARVLATTDNPDAPEGDACDDYLEDHPNRTEDDWDKCTARVSGGRWNSLGICEE